MAPNYLIRNYRDSGLSYGEDPESLCHLGLIRYRVVTDGRTKLTGTCRSTRRHTVQRHAEPRRPPLASRQRQNQTQGHASDLQNINYAPTHVSSRLAPVPRHVRSSEHHLLYVAGARSVFGSQTCCHAAPTVWNSFIPLK